MKEEKKKVPLKSKVKSAKKTAKIFAVGALIGVVVGGIVGLLKAPKKGEEFEKDIKERFNVLKCKFEGLKKKFEPKLRVIFGQVSNDTLKIYHEIRDDIVESSSRVKGKLTQKKYQEVVNKVINTQKKKKKKLSKKLDQLGDEFKNNWSEIKDLFV